MVSNKVFDMRRNLNLLAGLSQRAGQRPRSRLERHSDRFEGTLTIISGTSWLGKICRLSVADMRQRQSRIGSPAGYFDADMQIAWLLRNGWSIAVASTYYSLRSRFLGLIIPLGCCVKLFFEPNGDNGDVSNYTEVENSFVRRINRQYYFQKVGGIWR